MIISEIQAALAAVEDDPSLYEEARFASRTLALDALEVHVIDRIEGLLHTARAPDTLRLLLLRAQGVRRALEEVDDGLFQRLRAELRAGRHRRAALRDIVASYVHHEARGRDEEAPGYDALDLFVNGLLGIAAIPDEAGAREAEMVSYQQTPARVIFEIVERARLTEADVLYDIGSGLGHVPILVHLLTGARARGVEVEAAYCEAATARTADLGLTGVAFVNTDARAADYVEGTVFYMYTPFTGAILRDVLERLREEARRRPIRLLAYGPCAGEVSRLTWLTPDDQRDDRPGGLHAFSSR
ncbi:MAG: hypothetical protein RLZZ387_3169 [Chloroflexota bacterium]|jgi:protein-L-isoaspartate O-methyltransferase